MKKTSSLCRGSSLFFKIFGLSNQHRYNFSNTYIKLVFDVWEVQIYMIKWLEIVRFQR